MTAAKTYPRCTVCLTPDKRRIIEAAWNAGMSPAAIRRVVDAPPTSDAILRHIKEHTDGDGNARQLEIEPELPVRDRVLNLQRLQLDEIERRIALAKTRADDMNREREHLVDADGKPFPPVDWSEFTDILGKNMQAAIGSILKTQGLSDKREKAQGDLKLGLFEAMTNAGLAPKALIGGVRLPALQSGEEIEGELVDD
jgi:hypothetical protein